MLPTQLRGTFPITTFGVLLVDQMENVSVYPEELLSEPELVVRGSTGPVPVGPLAPVPVAMPGPAL